MKRVLAIILMMVLAISCFGCTITNGGNQNGGVNNEQTGGGQGGGNTDGGDQTGGENQGGENQGGENTGGENTGGENQGGGSSGDENEGAGDQGGDALQSWRDEILGKYKKFYTFSLDDGVTQDARFISLLNKYNLKATFNVNTGLCGTDTTANLGGATNPSTGALVTHKMVTAQEIQNGYYGDNEIASHTYSHPSLIRDAVTETSIKNQINPDLANIKAWTGKDAVGMAYPGPGGHRVWYCSNCGSKIRLAQNPGWCPNCGSGNTFTQSEVELDFASGMNVSASAIRHIKNGTPIKYGRTIENSYSFAMPKDFMAWSPTCSFKDIYLMLYAQSFRETVVTDGYALFYVWGHTYEFDMADPTNTSSDDWARVEGFLKYMSETEDAICLTNEEVYTLFADKIPSGARKFVTMSFDDGTTYDEQIANVLNKYGLKATFFINSGILGQGIGVNDVTRLTESQIRAAINDSNGFYRGHDIASHGYTHAPGGFAENGTIKWTHQDIIAEMQNDLNKISTITGKKPIGCAYPGGASYLNGEVVNVIKYFTDIQFARYTGDTYQFNLPADWLKWQPTCEVLSDDSLNSGFDLVKFFNEYANSESDDYQVFYLWDHPWAVVLYGKTQVFDNFCSAVKDNEDKVVCLTNTEFYKLFENNELN